jgi:pimeloyl-ACP methyl ester carboxylesterase
VAAPATDLGELLADDIGTVSGVTIASYAFNAYSNVYGASEPDARLTTILTPAGAAATREMAALCLFGQQSELHDLARPLVGHYLAGDPRTTLPWSSLLTQNTPGAVKLTAPLFIAQGQTDTLVHPASTARFAAHERSLGTAVTYDFIPKTGHGLVALRAIPALMKWLAKIAH